MTTIAYKDGVLAADGQMTEGHVVINKTFKKIYKTNIKYADDTIIYVGMAGKVWQFDQIIAHFTENVALPDHDCQAILIGELHSYILDHKALMPFRIDDVLAVGSGSDFALSAMRLGLSAVEAVRHACTLDVYSGGRIRSVNTKGF